MSKLGPNHPCHCGSGRKYKRCCLKADKTRRSRTSMVGTWVGIVVFVSAAVIIVGSFGKDSAAPTAYQYDANRNQHWDPTHGHWHDGPPPAGAVVGGDPDTTPEPWYYDAASHRHWNPDHGHWHGRSRASCTASLRLMPASGSPRRSVWQ